MKNIILMLLLVVATSTQAQNFFTQHPTFEVEGRKYKSKSITESMIAISDINYRIKSTITVPSVLHKKSLYEDCTKFLTKERVLELKKHANLIIVLYDVDKDGNFVGCLISVSKKSIITPKEIHQLNLYLHTIKSPVDKEEISPEHQYYRKFLVIKYQKLLKYYN